jgi:GrpB-like predicted nucleotidyltransferase (UPF0157 family)
MRGSVSTWSVQAQHESSRLSVAQGDVLQTVHHIGSTAIPGICAKPIVDLLPVVRSLVALDALQAQVQALGYVWRGELGLPGRRCYENGRRSWLKREAGG